MNPELTFLNALQTLRTPFLDALMPLISNGLVLWLLLPAAMLLSKKTRRAGIVVLLAMVLDVVVCNLLLKNAIRRVRPCDVNQAVTLLVARPTDWSFPSGHTAFSFAAVAGLWYSGVWKKLRIPALVFACLISFSRLYLYLHYPTDVLAGAAVGILCGYAAVRMVRRLGVSVLQQSGAKA